MIEPKRLRSSVHARIWDQLSSSTVSFLPLLFLSVPSDVTVLCVLLLCVCLYIPGWLACRRADAVSEQNRRIHQLRDNSPQDQHLYAVTISTGPCSPAHMSARVTHFASCLNDQSAFKTFCALGDRRRKKASTRARRGLMSVPVSAPDGSKRIPECVSHVWPQLLKAEVTVDVSSLSDVQNATWTL